MTKVRVGSGVNVRGGRPSTIKVSEDGSFKGSQPEIDFTGNASVTNDPTNNKIIVEITGGGSGGGTVTSVGALSPLFTTANPTTTPTFTAVNQNANLVYAGPATAPAAAPTFRALVATDLPSDSGAYWKTNGPTTIATSVVTVNTTNSVKIINTDGGTESGLYINEQTNNLLGTGLVAFGDATVGMAGSNLTGTQYSAISSSKSGTVYETLLTAQGSDVGDITDEILFVIGRDSSFTAGQRSYATFTDNRTTKVGIEYFGDYGTTFTNRSLVDKGYVLGAKTYTGVQTFSLTSLHANNTGIDVVASGGSDILNIGTSNADVINIGYSGSTINITGTLAYQNVTNLQVTDKLFTVNKGGGLASGVSSGFEIEENAVITGYFATNGTRDGWDFKAPAITAVATLSLASLASTNRTYTLPNASGTIALTSDIILPAQGGTGIANNNASTLTISGNFATTLTVTGITGVTLPTSGTLVNSTQAWTAASGVALTGTNTISGAQTVAFTNTEVTFLSTVLKIRNPANTFQYTISAGAIGANRTVGIPVLGGTSFFLAGESGQMVANRLPYIGAGDGQVLSSANLTFVTNRLLGTTLYLTVSAGTATAGTCPLIMTSGTNLTVAISGGIEYNNTFHMTNSDATRRHVVLCASATKTTAGAPYANDGYITQNIGGTDVKIMTTA